MQTIAPLRTVRDIRSDLLNAQAELAMLRNVAGEFAALYCPSIIIVSDGSVTYDPPFQLPDQIAAALRDATVQFATLQAEYHGDTSA